MSKGVDTIARHIFTKERQPQAMSELLKHQPNQPSQQGHAASYSQLTQQHMWGVKWVTVVRYL